MNRYKKLLAIAAFSMLVLSLPVVASAQWRGGNNDNYGNRNNVNLSYAIKNLRNNSRRFEDLLDRELDNSRYDGTDREDHLNDLAKKFKNAAEDLDDEYEGRGSFGSSSDEARRLLNAGSQLDRALARSRIGRNSSLNSYWNAIERDLLTVSRAYNYNYNGTYGRNGRNGDGPIGGPLGNNGRNNRNLRSTIVNLRNKAKNFENRVDREYDNRNRRGNRTDLEDLSDRFKNAADRLEDEYDDRGDYNRSADEVRTVLNLGQQIDRAISRSRVSSSIRSDWNRIEQDLRVLANAYNLNYGNNGRWGNNFPF
ncbi:MAG: hypothetical protein R2747_23075 [Pyrinomonadaceae bacterium]